MDFEKFTDRARTVLQGAQGLALKNKNQHFSPEHLLKALLDDDQKLTVNLITAAGGRPDMAADLTERALAALPKVESASGQLYLAPKTAEVFTTAGSDEKRDYLRSLGVKHVFSSRSLDFADQVLDATGCVVGPGLVELHAHLRQPGFDGAGTLASAARSAALGGYTYLHHE